jgi:hypothetical protein
LRGVVAACALTFSLASTSGCGGAMRADELSASVDTLTSSAASGELLARDVARDRTKATFARVYSRELSEVADHEAEKLADAQARPPVDAEKARAVQLANQISQALGQIQVSPGDESVGRTAERQLRSLSERTQRLGDQL